MGTNVFLLQNSLKVYLGRKEALSDKAILAKKQAEEKDLRAKVAANPELRKEYGGAWDEVAHAVELAKPEMQKRIFRRTDSQLFSLALQIVQYVVEVKKPDGDRLPQYHEAGLDSLRYQMLSPAPIHPPVEKLYMTTALKLAKEKLGADDAYLQAILQGGDIDKTVDALVDGTKLGDPAFRKSLLDGGEAAVAASTDPMIVAARRVDPVWRASYKYYRENVTSVFEAAGEKLGKARFAAYGKNAYPDATFTLRLSYGTVDGYPYNGTIAPPFTTFYGLYDRAASFSNQSAVGSDAERGRGPRQTRPGDADRFRLHGRHHRRQLRLAGGEPRGRTGGADLRRQHRIAGRRLRLRRHKEPRCRCSLCRNDRGPAQDLWRGRAGRRA